MERSKSIHGSIDIGIACVHPSTYTHLARHRTLPQQPQLHNESHSMILGIVIHIPAKSSNVKAIIFGLAFTAPRHRHHFGEASSTCTYIFEYTYWHTAIFIQASETGARVWVRTSKTISKTFKSEHLLRNLVAFKMVSGRVLMNFLVVPCWMYWNGNG